MIKEILNKITNSKIYNNFNINIKVINKKYYVLATFLTIISLLVKYISSKKIDLMDILICLAYFVCTYIFTLFFKIVNIKNPMEDPLKDYKLIKIEDPKELLNIDKDYISILIDDKENLYPLKMITEFREEDEIFYITIDKSHLIIPKEIINDRFLRNLRINIAENINF